MKAVHILWDASQIWGLLAVRAVEALGLPHALARASDIAEGLLRRDPAPLLLVPGGSARQKAAALGEAGLAAIREYVRSGGNYLGFCGGAGLALSSPGGLGLCPLHRAAFTERLQHFMSGHLHVRLDHAACPGLLPDGLGPTVELPVWWPGRFESADAAGVHVPAEFAGPADDFCLADLPIASLPAGTFEVWQDLYGFSPTPSFLEGSPCMVAGDYGAGRYILSYSHLETPDSADAGKIFAHLLRVLTGHEPARNNVPAWDFSLAPEHEPHPLPARLREICAPVFELGLAHGLLFRRTPWLLGWRTGIPGAALNSLCGRPCTAPALRLSPPRPKPSPPPTARICSGRPNCSRPDAPNTCSPNVWPKPWPKPCPILCPPPCSPPGAKPFSARPCRPPGLSWPSPPLWRNWCSCNIIGFPSRL